MHESIQNACFAVHPISKLLPRLLLPTRSIWASPSAFEEFLQPLSLYAPAAMGERQ